MKRFVVLFAIALVCIPLSAGDKDVMKDQHRPRVGVVMSGGGAKGVAHIGVLKVLEEKGIPVDYVVGTSIGSIIGGLYSLGYDSDELDSLVRSQDWEFLMNDLVPRRATPYKDRLIEQKCVAIVPFKNQESFEQEQERRAQGVKRREAGRKGILNNIPSALVQGQNLESLFTKFSVGYQDDIDFNELPIPFACVAVDLNTKEEVVFRRGDIVQAIRASMSIPGYFAPVSVGDKFLVDGGMVNNFPVDVAHQMGADIVIGIDLHQYDKSRTKDVENIGDMVGSMLSIMNGHKYNNGRDNADLIIAPNTGAYGILDFDAESVSALVDSGLVAARRCAPFLDSLAEMERQAQMVEESLYNGPSRAGFKRPRAVNIEQDSVYIAQVTSSGVSPRDMNWLLQRTSLKCDTWLDGDELEESIRYLYESQAFSKVKYHIAGAQQDSAYNLKLEFTPANRHQLGLGFRFDNSEMAELFFHLGFNRHRMFGFKSDINMRLSSHPFFEVSALYTLGNRSSLDLSLKHYLAGVNYVGESEYYSQRRTHFGMAELTFDTPALKSSIFRIGARLDCYNMKMDGFELSETCGLRFCPMAEFRMDTFDDPYFPTKGVKMEAAASYYFADLSYSWGQCQSYVDFLDARFNVQGAIPLGKRVVLMPQYYARWVSDENAPLFYSSNVIGGYIPSKVLPWQIPVVGTSRTLTALNCVSVSRLDLMVNVSGNHYVKAAGNMLHSSTDPMKMMANWTHGEDLFFGCALGYSYKSMIGPLSFIFQWSDTHPSRQGDKKFGVYLSLGYDF